MIDRESWRNVVSATALAATGVLSPLAAQAQDGTDTQQISTDEIIVMARRKEESLQSVPQTVNAVTGASIDKLNLQRFEDVQAIVPGLNLTTANNGFSVAASLRGVPYDSNSAGAPTVEFYMNDALISPALLFQSMYDVGQIEVLRGPQGTLRGRASPSGSITVTTRRPQLDGTGGYVNMTGTSLGGINANAALNIPLVEGIAALRLAGIIDENDLDGTKSLNNGSTPYSRTKAGRISLRVAPSDTLTLDVVYSHSQRRQRSFAAVESRFLTEPSAAAGTGPVITADDRLGITDDPLTNRDNNDIVSAAVNWKFAGQQLDYVFSYADQKVLTSTPQDAANAFEDQDFSQITSAKSHRTTHEVRLSSDERLFGALDYTLGFFYSNLKGFTEVANPTAVALSGTPPTLLTIVNTPISGPGSQEEKSLFGNLVWHFGESTELSGGVRQIWSRTKNYLEVAGTPIQDADIKSSPVIYNVSLSHRFGENLMIYATTGSAWREGSQLIGVFRSSTPNLARFTQLQPEKSKTYEIGFKSELFGKRLRFNVSAFHQDFDGYLYKGPEVPYVNISNGVETLGTFGFGANVPAKVNGVEIEAIFQPSPRFSLSASASYAKAEIKSGVVACNDGNGDGIPDATPSTIAQIEAVSGGDAVASCQITQRLTTAPPWSLTVQSDYTLPLSASVDGFARGLVTYNSHNSNQATNPYDSVDAYALVNLYLGIRSNDGAWEISAFAKNLFGTDRRLSRNINPASTSFVDPLVGGVQIQSAYATVTTTPRQEFGLNVRYAFGTR